MEDSAKNFRLDGLEAEYYRLVLDDSWLAQHLAAPDDGFRYAGACRAITNLIPETSVAALTAIAAGSIRNALASPDPVVRVWTLDSSGSVALRSATPSISRRVVFGEWQIVLDDALANKAADARIVSLPSETGGVLVGTVDTGRKVVVLVDIFLAPADCVGNPESFERGTVGLSPRRSQRSRSGLAAKCGTWANGTATRRGARRPRATPTWPHLPICGRKWVEKVCPPS
jgi:hypothetical protein